MNSKQLTQADTDKAKRIWDEYQRSHDLSGRIGQTVGIDPQDGQIRFGESIRDIVAQRDADSFESPLFFQRVGSDAYVFKGGFSPFTQSEIDRLWAEEA